MGAKAEFVGVQTKLHSLSDATKSNADAFENMSDTGDASTTDKLKMLGKKEVISANTPVQHCNICTVCTRQALTR